MAGVTEAGVSRCLRGPARVDPSSEELVYNLFSVDDHIVEPADVWTSRVGKKFGDAIPHVVEEDGREFWVFDGRRETQMGLNAVAGKPREEWGREPIRFTDMIPGCYVPEERRKDLLSNGIFASVAFPTLPGFGGRKFFDFKDKDLALACVRAWNDFVLEEWCAAAPDMFVPMTIAPVWDPKLAAAEVERTAALGSKALCWVEEPGALGQPGLHGDHWDPLFAAVQDASIPVCMHIGSAGATVDFDPSVNPMVAIATAFAGAAFHAVNMMCSPIPRKFPDVKYVWSEGGIGWLPAALERADRQWERHRYWTDMDETLPSEICKRSMYFCMIEEPWGLTTRDYNGVDNILWECDYPHADTPWPSTQAACKALFTDVEPDVIEKVTHSNAEKLFDFPLSQGLIAQYSAPVA
jgi:predicted TIM-barrel fold metal-dependent hydrolase